MLEEPSNSQHQLSAKTIRAGITAGPFWFRVPLTGLEPVVSALRGRRVNHLHYSGRIQCSKQVDFEPASITSTTSLIYTRCSLIATCDLKRRALRVSRAYPPLAEVSIPETSCYIPRRRIKKEAADLRPPLVTIKTLQS